MDFDYYDNNVRVEDFIGKVFTSIVRDDDEILFTCDTGEQYKMFHGQDCCESVDIEDICGDLDDLIGNPILKASEDTNNDNPKSDYNESCTWTFYNLSTIKGSVTIRWYGSSNGYYSESVSIIKGTI